MLFLKCNAVCLLRRCYYPLASTLVKYHYANLPASGVTSPYRSTLTTTRSLSITWTLRADAPQPKDTQTLDLDIWKSVMKSQTVQEEKPNGEEESSSTEEGELSPLEASRRLVETWRQAGRQVPDYVTDEQLESLAELTTKSSKRKYLKFLAIKEGHKKANKEKKEKRRMERKEWMGRVDGEPEGENGEAKLNNTFLLKFWSRSKDKVLGWRAAQAMQYGQPLIFDMSYEQHMSRMEIQNTISQLLETEGWNRRATDPFHLHFCNLQPDSSYQRELLKRYGPETWQNLLITTTSQSHVDLFPRESLVYLTADSRNVLYTFNHSKVYIIGALVDRSSQSSVSLANAKRLNLATARLPLDEFLHWECGAKNLTLDQMIRILLTAKDTGSWEKALEFVPKRKHDGFYKHTRENEAKSTPLVTGGKPVNSNRNPARERAKIFVSKQKNPKGQGVDWKRSFESDNTMSGQTRLRSTLKSKMEERHKTE
ncbi:tRNA methyltransferase 10 homolog C [Electrophorus electricus]|uniref:tRNA methyltransferase 10 homolog C n=1 Tax=Electrophorus electricus TaxID=8005 RepID=A0A4W4FSZ7_ELEEL|nr:tRNA methyltransferase 10 homolog C [Electrophorus electricus]